MNQSRTPARRTQAIPGPVVQASGADVTGILARLAALESLATDQAAQIEAAQAELADHEARIAALEAGPTP
ncbi:hypothetical protein [Novosphingobium sp. ST904]|uniref:hypothetical protein n=1 Tax=Novosphingobium sp. ST904 TaxID=1684385 RepID=UPI0006C8CC10|nr:hypothetical protein [Novosphingobium sp. ST904]KPH66953.1 hypothetical protein ADT71_03535 [Novosphingobium sp. ST904]